MVEDSYLITTFTESVVSGFTTACPTHFRMVLFSTTEWRFSWMSSLAGKVRVVCGGFQSQTMVSQRAAIFCHGNMVQHEPLGTW